MIPKKPKGVSIAKLKKDPYGYSRTLNRQDAIDLATYLDYKYHDKNDPEVSDQVHDALISYIKERWPKSKYLKKVGHEVTGAKARNKVQLPVFMPSLSKLKPEDKKLVDFIDSSLVISEKLDGISLLVQYENGYPYAAYTRGDGKTGQDVSGVLPALRIPKSISIKGTFIVRCEFIIRKKTFSGKHSKTSGGEFSTGRNMAGGVLTKNKPSKAVKDFRVVAYEIPKGKNAGGKISSQYQLLRREGFEVVNSTVMQKPTPDLIKEMHDKMRKASHYDIDGIVLTKDTSYRVSDKNPKHAYAFKINSQAAAKVVTVKEVQWRRTRHGRLMPRIVIEPTEIGGVQVQYFTGHSYYFIQHGHKSTEKGKKPVRPINVGAQVRGIRSGDVIPYIMDVTKPARTAAKPESSFKLDANKVHALEVREKSQADPELRKKHLVHFFSTMGVEGIKAGTVDKLYAAGLKTIKSILDADVNAFQKAEGIEAKTAVKLADNRDKAMGMNTYFATVGYASNVFGSSIGKNTLQAVIDMYPQIMEMSRQYSPLELQKKLEEVPGVKSKAPLIAKGLPKLDKFLTKHNITLLGEKKTEFKRGRLRNMSVLFTGVRDRDLMEAIKEKGGKESPSVKSATHIISKEGYTNKKIYEAQDMGLPIYTIEEFKHHFKL